jgi:hypothetical protein
VRCLRTRSVAPAARQRGLDPEAGPVAEQDAADAGEGRGDDEEQVGEHHVVLLLNRSPSA